MDNDRIPFANPLSQYLAYKVPIDEVIRKVLNSGYYILGDETGRFEEEFAAYIGVRFGVGVANGTDALVLAIKACGIGVGDEVITTPLTAVATVAAIELAGATPVLAEVEAESCLLSPEDVERRITQRTKAIIPVHIFGQPANIKEFQQIAERHDLWLIEDCAQAHGASIQDKKIGSFGDLACFSFYPTKNLGAIGDGGMVVTDTPALEQRLRGLREYGWMTRRYVSEFTGMNSRLDELQAAILRIKLKGLESDNEKRRNIANSYDQGIAAPIVRVKGRFSSGSVHHLYVVKTKDRSKLQNHLDSEGITTGIHYPVPIHLQPAYQGRLGDHASFPIAEELAGSILSLPMYPELSKEQTGRVVRALAQFVSMPSGLVAGGSQS